MQHNTNHYILKISCPATFGIIAPVTTFLAPSACYISEMAQFNDEFHERFSCAPCFVVVAAMKLTWRSWSSPLPRLPRALTCIEGLTVRHSRCACC